MSDAHHDSGYKYLFSHAELVRELLETFAPPGVAAQLDYATLRRENGHYVTPALKQREQDVVWSVRLAGLALYLPLHRISRAIGALLAVAGVGLLLGMA